MGGGGECAGQAERASCAFVPRAVGGSELELGSRSEEAPRTVAWLVGGLFRDPVFEWVGAGLRGGEEKLYCWFFLLLLFPFFVCVLFPSCQSNWVHTQLTLDNG